MTDRQIGFREAAGKTVKASELGRLRGEQTISQLKAESDLYIGLIGLTRTKLAKRERGNKVCLKIGLQ